MKINWKKLLRSRTLWFNFIAFSVPLLAENVDVFQGIMTAHAYSIFVGFVTFGNFVIRFATSEPLITQAIQETETDVSTTS